MITSHKPVQNYTRWVIFLTIATIGLIVASERRSEQFDDGFVILSALGHPQEGSRSGNLECLGAFWLFLRRTEYDEQGGKAN